MYIALDGCQTFFLQRSEADATEGPLGILIPELQLLRSQHL